MPVAELDPVIAAVPTDLGHWLLALLPIAILLLLLIGVRWKAPEAGPLALVAAVAVALLAFETSWSDLAVATGKGVWDGIFILYVVWPALLLYRVTDGAGALQALREHLVRFSRNGLFLVLALGWVFASFLQGVTGFGAPIAVVAPLLVALGVRPITAVVIPLIGHAWANLFGTLGVAWLGTKQVIDLDDETATALLTAVMLWIPNLLAGIFIAWIFGRTAAVRRALPLVLVVTAIHGGGQLALAGWNPSLAAFLPATVAMVALIPLSRWQRYSDPDPEVEDSPAMEGSTHPTEEEVEGEPAMSLAPALLPYAVLVVLAVGVLAFDPVEEVLEGVEVGLAFPGVETGYEVEQEAEDPYEPFTPLTHPGTMLLIASGVAAVVYRRSGHTRRWRDEHEVESVAGGLVSDAVPASVAIVSFLVLSRVMDHSGQTESLALGLAEVAPPTVFAFLAAWIGLLGSFMTTSNTSSNILFAPLQQTVAEAEALSEPAILAAQHAGGAVGNAIAPANVALGSGTAGVGGSEGAVLRSVLPFALISTALIGIVTVVVEIVS